MTPDSTGPNNEYFEIASTEMKKLAERYKISFETEELQEPQNKYEAFVDGFKEGWEAGWNKALETVNRIKKEVEEKK